MAKSWSCSNFGKDLAFLIVQFLDEHNLTDTARALEREGKLFFNMKYVEEAVKDGNWKDLENYILDFTKIDENALSTQMIFEIRKQRYIEALDSNQYSIALEILTNELQPIVDAQNEEIYNELAQLICLNNVRENEKLGNYYTDTETARRSIFAHLKKMIERNPALKDKLNYPIIEHSRLKGLMNHSLNCQHLLCKSPEANPAVSTLFVDHTCGDEVVLSLNDGDCRGLGYLINACKTDERNNSVVPEISEQAQLYTLRLPDPILTSKIDRIAYNNSGFTIFALSCSGALKFWNMKTENANEAREVSYSGFLSNDVGTGEHELVVPCFALSKNDSYVASAWGGKVSLFGLQTSEIELFKNLTTVMSPPPAATCAMFYPEDNNFIIFGMEDGSIRIYDVRTDQVKAQIKAHDQTRVTGLAYSSALNILVSSAYNAEISSWSNFALIKQTRKFLDIGGHVFPGRTCVKFQQDQKLMLVVHENCLATLEGPDLKLCSQWVSNELISDATYSCDGLTIYASFIRGRIVIFDSSFTERCIINPSAYIPKNPSTMVNCWAIAAHPNEPNQFALGLGDGSVLVVEPGEGNWPGTPQLDNVAAGEKDHEMPVDKKLI